MKAFLEEYGLIVVVLIAFAVMIALAVWASHKGSQSATAAINGFTDKTSTIMQENGVPMGSAENVGNIGGTVSPTP